VEGDVFRRAFAEFVGTFALLFAAVGATLTLQALSDPSPAVGIALANGITIAVMVSAVGHISGGHFNPAVTFGFLITRRMAPLLAVVYWITQLAAAAIAVLLLRWIYPGQQKHPGEPALGIGSGAGVVVEGILTFFLVWVVFATAADPRGAFKSISGLAIGLTITIDILVALPLTGGAMNPARAFGPELVANVWGDAWVWYVGPLAGGGLAALLYDWLYLRPLAPGIVGPPESGLEEPRPGDAAVS
jgi:aquaporin TIP